MIKDQRMGVARYFGCTQDLMCWSLLGVLGGVYYLGWRWLLLGFRAIDVKLGGVWIKSGKKGPLLG